MFKRDRVFIALGCICFLACSNKSKKVAVWESYLNYDTIVDETLDTFIEEIAYLDSQDVYYTDELEEPLDLAVLSNNIELPAYTTKDIIVKHTAYSLSFNKKTNLVKWVAWSLTSDRSDGSYSRTDDYRADGSLPGKYRIEETAYKGSGYDRGHMCPAADNKWSYQAMSESFLMSNMCPQDPKLNQVWWDHLEKAERRWASQEGCVYICCGPIYDKQNEARYIGKDVKIRVPDAFFKVLVSLQHGKEKGIGFYYKNDNSRQTMDSAALSIDQVEELTGYDFFACLPNEIENRIEAQNKLSDWK